MVGFFCETTKEGVDGVDNNLKAKTLNDSERDSFGCGDQSTELDGLSLASLEPFVDFDFIKDWIEEMEVPDSAECNNAEIGSGVGENRCLDNSTSNVFAQGMDDKETCGTVKAECCGTDELVVENGGGIVGVVKSERFEESSLSDFIKVDFIKVDLGSAETTFNGHKGDIMSSDNLEDGTCVGMLDVRSCSKLGDLSCSIEEGLGRVSLGGVPHGLVVDVNEKNEMGSKIDCEDTGTNSKAETESESESESESETSSSSSSSSSGSDDEAKEMVKVEVLSKTKTDSNEQKVEVEEGEIMDSDAEKMISWTDKDNDNDHDDDSDEDQDDNATESSHDLELGDILDDDDGDAELPKGPIRSKNELQDLPPVPQVTVSLQPSHQILPVGAVLSVLGTQVIVEGSEKHNPISEGSILWITETRLPLGIIDEIFGPVKTPYYIVRYNLESEVPSDIQNGTRIGFVSEFVGHVLNEKSLYQKGYDASGENDEEIEETEFSDDEKEAEFKRMLKMSKRGNNNESQGPGTKKKNTWNVKGRENTWTKNQPSASQSPMLEVPLSQQQHLWPPSPCFTQGNQSGGPSAQSFGQSNQSSSSPLGPIFSGGPNTFNQMPQRGPVTFNGNWTNGMPSQPQNVPISSGFQLISSWANNGMPSQPQNMAMSSGFQPSGNWAHNGIPSQPQNMAMSSGFQPNGMPWVQQSYPQPSNGPTPWQHQQPVSQFPLGTVGPSQPQFDLSQLLAGSLLGPMNFNMGASNSPWSGMTGPNLSGQAPFMNPNAQLPMFSGFMPNGPQSTGLNSNYPTGNEEVSPQTHQGVSSCRGRGRGRGRGRNSFQQRGGRFGGGRSR